MKKLELTDDQAGMLLKIFAEGTGPFAWAELIADIRRQLCATTGIALVDPPGAEDGDAGS